VGGAGSTSAGVANTVHLPAVIADAFGLSRSEARRLLAQGAVFLDDVRLGENDQNLPVAQLDGKVLKAGKRRFRRLRLA
jgi:tyrosyl-tRNA synthetase